MNDFSIEDLHEALDAMVSENDRLKQHIAVECLDMTEEGKLLAHELIEALKGEVATLKAELFAAKSQRDVLLSENARLKTQVINLRGKR